MPGSPDRPPARTQALAGPGPESDVDTVVRLAAPATARTLASYSHPLAPAAAARLAGLAAPDLSTVSRAVQELTSGHDLVLIEGAGGLLVPMGPAGDGRAECWTVADLAAAVPAPAVVVTRAGLGTLNHTALTLEALARRGVDALVVVGEWPAEPQLVHGTNLRDLPGVLAGVLPERAGVLPPPSFRAGAPAWLAPALHGVLDAAGFRAAGRA
jgi:dethiobiotin synthetase